MFCGLAWLDVFQFPFSSKEVERRETELSQIDQAFINVAPSNTLAIASARSNFKHIKTSSRLERK